MRTTGFTRAVRVVAALIATGLGVATSGCGPGDGPATRTVTGKVTFDGQPLPEGRITFRPTGNGPSYSGPIENGAYKLKCEPGPHEVVITASRIIPGKFDTSNPGMKEPVGEMYVPTKYNAETILKADVGTGTDEFNFDLTSEKTK